MADVDYVVKRLPDGRFKATLILPVTGPGATPVNVATKGGTEREALSRAAAAASAIVDSPILQAVLPPGSGMAIKAIKMIAGSKNVKKAMKKIVGPGAKRLAKAIFGW